MTVWHVLCIKSLKTTKFLQGYVQKCIYVHRVKYAMQILSAETHYHRGFIYKFFFKFIYHLYISINFFLNTLCFFLCFFLNSDHYVEILREKYMQKIGKTVEMCIHPFLIVRLNLILWLKFYLDNFTILSHSDTQCQS